MNAGNVLRRNLAAVPACQEDIVRVGNALGDQEEGKVAVVVLCCKESKSRGDARCLPTSFMPCTVCGIANTACAPPDLHAEY